MTPRQQHMQRLLMFAYLGSFVTALLWDIPLLYVVSIIAITARWWLWLHWRTA